MEGGYSEQILVYYKPQWQETDSGDAVVVASLQE